MHRLLPKEGILDDYGADVSKLTKPKSYLEECISEHISIPENCLALIKQHQARNQEKSPHERKTKKITDVEKAFPLEDSESFWTRMFDNKKEDTETIDIERNSHKSYISFSVKEGLDDERENEKLILSDDQRKIFNEAAPGDEKLEIKPKVGKKSLARQKKAEREKTKGSDWFDMKAPEITEEVKRDLEVLQMRGALDPKRFYKKNDRNVLPKYFQIGQYVDGPLDHSKNGQKKGKKKSLVDELMADAEFKKYSKRKYTEIIEEKSKLQPKRFRGKSKSKKEKTK